MKLRWEEIGSGEQLLINGYLGNEVVVQIVNTVNNKIGWVPLVGFYADDCGTIKEDSTPEAQRKAEAKIDEWCKSAGLREDRVCEWVPEEGESYWHTSCGDDFILVDGTPEENHIIYCHYCGGRVTIKESEAGK